MLDVILLGALPGFLTGFVVGALSLLTYLCWDIDNVVPPRSHRLLRKNDDGEYE